MAGFVEVLCVIQSPPLFRLIAAVVLLWGLPGLASAAPKPNILLILADDLGINDLGCYGRKEHSTPHLDKLSTEGIRFTAAYCAQPICSPSRAALLTGKAPARLHLTTYLPGRPDAPSQKLLHPKMHQQLPLEETTLAEYLKPLGYSTAAIGKWHLGGKEFGPDKQGFDFVFDGKANTTPTDMEGGKGEYELTRKAEAFLEENAGKPFFLYLAHNNPHIPLAAKTNLIRKNAAAFNPLYAAVIQTLDDSIGQLLATLERLKLRENTLVIFTSDNGGLHVLESPNTPATHNTPFRAGKGFLYEGGLRVPLIIRWPKQVPEGKTVNDPVLLTDLAVTLLDLVQAKSHKTLDGQTFAPLLLTQTSLPKRRLFWHFPHYTNQGGRPGGAVRDGDWKLIEHYEDGRLELFNLAADAREQHDLSSQESSRARELQKKLAEWQFSVGAQTNTVNPDFNGELHKKLYIATDVSKFPARKTAAVGHTELSEWRKGMNDALKR